MLHEDLNDINKISKKIEEALQDSNFIELVVIKEIKNIHFCWQIDNMPTSKPYGLSM